MNGAPLHRDTLALCGVLLEVLETQNSYQRLRERLAEGALHLLDHVILALAGFDRLARLEDADAELQTLRAHLLLALELGAIDQEDFLALAEQADLVGRQVGGWLKKLTRQADTGATV
jgi:hypothetical protein